MNKLALPSWFEVILVDDGSDPPISPVTVPTFNFQLVRTNDFRAWTQALAVNFGASYSKARYLWCSAIDHFISKEAIEHLSKWEGDKLVHPREFAILNESGEIVTSNDNLDLLIEYGVRPFEVDRKCKIGNGFGMFVIQRRLWDILGGYSSNYGVGYGKDDVDISKRYAKLYMSGIAGRHHVGPHVYVFPNPAGDIKGIFHSLRKNGVMVK
ncbi:MAG: hypothetical protein ACXAB9_12690 [Candidatus Thorarchaeota archaeon]|jgi:predicted glycosyltransferase involved in capsule biosynthesis